MTSKELIGRVKNVLSTKLELDVSVIDDDSDIAADLGADSLDIVEIVMAMEDEFEIEILDAELERIRTVADYAKVIATKLREPVEED